jgi:hypothetical protein
VFLVLQGAIGDAALLVGEHGLGEDVAGLALVEPGVAAPAQLGALQPVEGEERALEPPELAEGQVEAVLAPRTNIFC